MTNPDPDLAASIDRARKIKARYEQFSNLDMTERTILELARTVTELADSLARKK